MSGRGAAGERGERHGRQEWRRPRSAFRMRTGTRVGDGHGATDTELRTR